MKQIPLAIGALGAGPERSFENFVPGSNGRITICVGSGAPTEASCLMGVGEPYTSTRNDRKNRATSP